MVSHGASSRSKTCWTTCRDIDSQWNLQGRIIKVLDPRFNVQILSHLLKTYPNVLAKVFSKSASFN
jgi:hypothetical protein